MPHRLRYFPVDASVFLLLVTGFRDPFDEAERQAQIQERHEWLSRLRRELLELVGFDELMLDLALRSGNISNRTSAEHFQISSSKANRAGHRGRLLIETGTLAKLILALMNRDGDAVVVPGRPLQVLRSRNNGWVVPLPGLSKRFSKSPNWPQVAQFVRKHWDVIHATESDCDGNQLVIAGWKDEGKFTTHVANVFESRKEALTAANQRGINVVYDFAARSVIDF